MKISGLGLLLLIVLMGEMMCYSTIQELAEKETSLKSISGTILEYHDHEFSTRDQKLFQSEVLAFITPWNRDGYERSVKFAKKIDILSPVWFNLKYRVGIVRTELYIEGHHEIDQQFLSRLRQKNPNIKIVPRLSFQLDETINSIVADSNYELVELIASLALQFDGILLDCPQLSYLSRLPTYYMTLIKDIYSRLHKSDSKLLIINFLGMNSQFQWDPQVFRELLKHTDRILVDSYDYPEQVRGMIPLSPIEWFRETAQYFQREVLKSDNSQLNKILLGLPFYGFKLNSKSRDHLISKEFLEILRREDKIRYQYSSKYQECIVKSSEYQIHYPCLKFLQKRLNLLQESYPGMGVMIWELGQGLDYMMELF